MTDNLIIYLPRPYLAGQVTIVVPQYEPPALQGTVGEAISGTAGEPIHTLD
jgi:hypothetical protein